MPGGQRAPHDLAPHGGGQLQQADGVGDVAARLADGRRQPFLSHGELTQQALQPLGLLDGVEVAPLQVLDQSRGHGVAIGEHPDMDRHLVQIGEAGRAPAAFASDDLVAIRLVRMRAGQDRLQDAARADGGCELLQRVRVHHASGLERTGLEPIDRQHVQALGAGTASLTITQKGG